MPNLVISNTIIPVDSFNRINLNALYKASKTAQNKQPSQWLRTASTKELIAELDQNANMHSASVQVNNGGKNQGTFAHELLAISYAGWISPKFQLQVNQAFLDAKRQPAPQLPNPKVIEKPVIIEAQDKSKVQVDKDKYIQLLESHIKVNEQELKKQAKRKPGRQRKFTDQEINKVLSLKANNIAIAEIARIMGRAPSSVKYVITRKEKEAL